MDKIFKIGLLVLGFSYLAYLFCPVANQVGRYQFRQLAGSVSVLDTTNADVYYLNTDTGKWARRNPILEGKQINKGGEEDGS